ncbi:outer membrane protein [Nitrospina gracilis]|uniref:outer membrane protein n=1 Tax=Nitrospina gracilis TaxID=35801 RepID=UPI001F1A2727|nr:outer membrane beta-barrel protein [Nitrospina gracilis]MCF8721397.1 opacity protein-like surface antigen [Nitrospina gracilis Nb-211]
MKRFAVWMAGWILVLGATTAWAGSPYVSGKVGGTGKFDNTLGAATLEFNTGISFLGAAGYEFDRPYRVELELGYNRNSFEGLNPQTSVSSAGSFSAFTTMVNAYFDVPLKIREHKLPVEPYIGAGIGLAVVRVQTKSANFVGNVPDSNTDVVGAWQAMVGFQTDLNPDWTLTGEFRLQYLQDPNLTLGGLNLDTSYETQQVLFGVRYRF